MRRGLQPVRQRLSVFAGAPRPVRELQRVRDFKSLRRRRLSSCACEPAVPAQNDEPWILKTEKRESGKAETGNRPEPRSAPVPRRRVVKNRKDQFASEALNRRASQRAASSFRFPPFPLFALPHPCWDGC